MNTPRNVGLKEVDGVEVVSLVDNTIDFLSSINRKEVHSVRQRVKTRSQFPMAEHGFSMFVRVKNEGKTTSILFDTGCSSQGIIENAKRLGLDLSEVEFVVLSHGHWDHVGGLLSALETIGKVDLPVIVHEDMFKIRGTANQDGTVSQYPAPPSRGQLSQAKLVETKKPFPIADGLALVTGEIPRVISYEKGYSKHRAFVNGLWQPDPLIWDDRAIVLNIKGKGLVVISGCSHAGIINTLAYAREIAGVESIYAIMGGFHLAGRENEERIDQTVNGLRLMAPKLVVPSHCTGWRAMCAIAEALPEAFVWNSVGNLYEI
jgi:7,8-dihydropterin-6-yl-methyl-4-(beta-D-ribofuranosyl)aminobenzene 5'-phosphate synthase